MRNGVITMLKQNPMEKTWSISCWIYIYIEKQMDQRGSWREINKMRKRDLLEFRTPQHPSLGTNNWGGASPLLARDIPKESLEQKYLKLNTVRTHDEIFIAEEDEFMFLQQIQAQATKTAPRPTPSRRGILLRLIWPQKDKGTLGSNPKKKRWLPEFNHKGRWPQGWC